MLESLCQFGSSLRNIGINGNVTIEFTAEDMQKFHRVDASNYTRSDDFLQWLAPVRERIYI